MVRKSRRRKSERANPQRAVVYVRVSTSEQSLGAEAQLEQCRRWAAAHGVTIAAECRDLGVSGGTPVDERPLGMSASACPGCKRKSASSGTTSEWTSKNVWSMGETHERVRNPRRNRRHAAAADPSLKFRRIALANLYKVGALSVNNCA